MKKFILVFALVISGAFYQFTSAQVHVNINIGSQPVWGPVGYDYVEYYYFPDIDAYYNVPAQQYIYFDGYNWVAAVSLPPVFGSFDPYTSYKVVINENEPYLHNSYYHDRYSSYRGRPQEIIYNSHEPKYLVINDHPEHNRYMRDMEGYNRRDNYGDRRANYGDRRDNYDGRRNDDGYERNDQRRYDNNRGDDNKNFGGYDNRENNRFDERQPDNRNMRDHDYSRNEDHRGSSYRGWRN